MGRVSRGCFVVDFEDFRVVVGIRFVSVEMEVRIERVEVAREELVFRIFD